MSGNTIILSDTHEGADTSDWVPVTGPALVAQAIGSGCTIEGTLYREGPAQTVVALMTVAGDGVPVTCTTSLAYVRAVSAGAGSVRVSSASAPAAGAGGSGGGGSSDTTEATQLAVKAAVQSIDTKTPALVGGKIPVADPSALPLPAGAATESTLSAASAKLPASLGGKPGGASLSVTAATGVVASISGSITAGGTAQVLAAANAARRGLTLQNTSSGELRVSPWGVASATAGYKVSAGDLLVLDTPHCGVGAVSVWGSATGQVYVGGESV